MPPPVLDLDLGAPQEAEDTLPPEPGPPPKRALIASLDREQRLYLRARLALAGLTQADDAGTAADALELARLNRYAIALVDFALAGEGGWVFIRQLRASEPGIPHVIVTKDCLSAVERLRAWFARQPVLLASPPHPGKLKALLERV